VANTSGSTLDFLVISASWEADLTPVDFTVAFVSAVVIFSLSTTDSTGFNLVEALESPNFSRCLGLMPQILTSLKLWSLLIFVSTRIRRHSGRFL
jgi:hypothetical protein